VDPATRFLSVFSDERANLDRVPTFVQGVLGGFVQKYESQLFDDCANELVFNTSIDPALVLGFDAVFASIPGSVICDSITITDETGTEHKIGMSGQINREGSSYYKGGLIRSLETLEQLQATMRIVDTSAQIKETMNFYERISNLIFPVPMIGGIFDTTWQSMGFTTFAKEYRKNSKLYQEILKNYAYITRANVEKVTEATGSQGKIINILDDVAFKGHTIISPGRWRQDLLPYYKEICSIIHDAGMHTMVHTDGDITDLVPSLIEAGFEGLQGWEGGADPRVIVDRFPDFVTVGWGDVGDVLPFGTPEKIEAHVVDLLNALKENRHVVLGPSTVIFEKMPLENVCYFMACIRAHGDY
jgi:hypothetical protein